MSMRLVVDEGSMRNLIKETTQRQWQIEVVMAFEGDPQLYPFCTVYGSTQAAASMKAEILTNGVNKK